MTYLQTIMICVLHTFAILECMEVTHNNYIFTLKSLNIVDVHGRTNIIKHYDDHTYTTPLCIAMYTSL